MNKPNYLQQLNYNELLWFKRNAILPYDPATDYPVGTVTLKDGKFQKWDGAKWVDSIELEDFASSINDYSDFDDIVVPDVVVVKQGGKEGVFVYSPGSFKTPDGGTVIKDSLGRTWERVFKGHPIISWFEPVADGVTDNTAKFTAANAVTGITYIPAGNYKTNLIAGAKYYGEGKLIVPFGSVNYDFYCTAVPQIIPTGILTSGGGTGGLPTEQDAARNRFQAYIGTGTGISITYLTDIANINVGSTVNRLEVAYYSANTTKGGGIFVADRTDNTSQDNGGTVIVSKDGTRWKRQVDGGRVSLADFGVLPDGSDVGALINKAFDACAGVYLLAADAGTYLTSVELKAPTGLRFVGAGMYSTLIKAHQNLPAMANLLTNKSNNYATRTESDHSIHIADIGFDADWRGRYDLSKPINNQACAVKFSAVRLSSLTNVRAINAALHCFDICADQYIDTGDVTANAVNQSEHIILRGCVAANPYRDDAFTTHNSRHITFEDCVALFDGSVSALGNTQQGFEADAGSSNIVFQKCYAKGYHCGFKTNGHATTRPAEAVSLIDCEADGCAFGAIASVGTNPSGKPGYKPQSVAIRNFIVSNPSGNAHLANPTALYISGADGVVVDGITISGSANIVVDQGAGIVDMRNIIFKDQLSNLYTGLIELRSTLTASADIRISNLTVKVIQPIPSVNKDSADFRMVLDGGWISGNSASTIASVRLRRSPHDVIRGLLSGLRNTIYLVNEGLYLTGDVQLDAYNRTFIQGNPISPSIVKAPTGTVSTTIEGIAWVQRNNDLTKPNWVKITP